MLTKFQQHFRYYLALVLSVLLAAGIRLRAAPLGSTPMPVEQGASQHPAAAGAGALAAR